MGQGFLPLAAVGRQDRLWLLSHHPQLTQGGLRVDVPELIGVLLVDEHPVMLEQHPLGVARLQGGLGGVLVRG